jgi:uncharacterized protein (DUF1501 family)
MNEHLQASMVKQALGKQLNRRNFMGLIGAVAAGEIAASQLGPLRRAFSAGNSLLGGAAPSTSSDGLVVFVYLDGGNDGLNTVIPMNQYDRYLELRTIPDPSTPGKLTSIAYGAPNPAGDPPPSIAGLSALAGDANVAFNPGLVNVASLYRAGRVAVLQGIGCKPNYSHFTSQDQWWSALGKPGDPLLDSALGYSAGWAGRYARVAGLGSFGTVGTNYSPSPALRGNPDGLNLPHNGVPGILNLANATDARLAKAVNGFSGQEFAPLAGDWNAVSASSIIDTPNIGRAYLETSTLTGTVDKQLWMAANLFNAGLGTRVVHCSAGGFDLHSEQRLRADGHDEHQRILGAVDTAIGKFYARLLPSLHRNVTVVVYSEFGRRPKMNDTLGTDHGTAGVAFVIGDNVRGGLYGEYPSLAAPNLVNGNMKITLDYRSLYATVIQDWLGVDAAQVLGADNARLALFAGAPGVDTTATTTTSTSSTSTSSTSTSSTSTSTTAVTTTATTQPTTVPTTVATTVATTLGITTTVVGATSTVPDTSVTTLATSTSVATTVPATVSSTTMPPTTDVGSTLPATVAAAPTTAAPTTAAPTTIASSSSTTGVPTTTASRTYPTPAPNSTIGSPVVPVVYVPPNLPAVEGVRDPAYPAIVLPPNWTGGSLPGATDFVQPPADGVAPTTRPPATGTASPPVAGPPVPTAKPKTLALKTPSKRKKRKKRRVVAKSTRR